MRFVCFALIATCLLSPINVAAIHSLKRQQTIEQHDMILDEATELAASLSSFDSSASTSTSETHASHLIGELDVSKWDKSDTFQRKEREDEKQARLAIAEKVDAELKAENYLPFMTVCSDDVGEVEKLFKTYCKLSAPEFLLLEEGQFKKRLAIFTQNIKIMQQLNVRTHYWATQDRSEPFYVGLTSLAHLSEEEWLAQYTYKASSQRVVVERTLAWAEKFKALRNYFLSLTSKDGKPLDETAQKQIKATQDNPKLARVPSYAFITNQQNDIMGNLVEMSESAHRHRRTMLGRLKQQAQQQSLTEQEEQQLDQLEQAVTHEQTHGVGSPAPDWDWRDKGVLNVVQNQKNCGICWAFASIGCIESVVAIQNYAGRYAVGAGPVYTLQAPLEASISNSVSCAANVNAARACGANGVNEGNEPQVMYDHAVRKGICQKNAVGVNNWHKVNNRNLQLCDTSCTRTDAPNTGVAHPPLHIDGYQLINNHDEGDMVWDVYRQPVSVVINACWYLALAAKGFFSNSVYTTACNRAETNHVVMIVGYGIQNGVNYWIMKNSWGKAWARQGYLKIARGTNILNMASGVTYPTLKAPNPAIARPAAQYAYIGGMVGGTNSPVNNAAHFTAAGGGAGVVAHPDATTPARFGSIRARWAQAANGANLWTEDRGGVQTQVPRYLNQWDFATGLRIP